MVNLIQIYFLYPKKIPYIALENALYSIDFSDKSFKYFYSGGGNSLFIIVSIFKLLNPTLFK